MACDVSTNWLTTTKDKLSCFPSGNFTVEELLTIDIGLKLELLLCEVPTALDEDTAATCTVTTGNTLSKVLERIRCGEVLSELEREWCNVNITLKRLQLCEEP
jgi:hypothetical protein